MISVVILTELLVEYTAALAKLTAGILPRRTGDRNAILAPFYDLVDEKRLRFLLSVSSS
ncbi:unnamed protein product [Arabidopsis thaliana]|uniref:(thale cress) hypothetical protein n=1 Tax=Arabidopsis thaliana TaxID=3702 RepID=A0A7G2FGR1_ARATH|nr:unnamed protein product [Arabidopsis thaliana]